MEKTTNYQLPKWEKSDFIKMDDFNDAFGTLDEKLKAAADAAAGAASAESVTAIAQALGSGGRVCRITTGSYTGNGKTSRPTSARSRWILPLCWWRSPAKRISVAATTMCQFC